VSWDETQFGLKLLLKNAQVMSLKPNIPIADNHSRHPVQADNVVHEMLRGVPTCVSLTTSLKKPFLYEHKWKPGWYQSRAPFSEDSWSSRDAQYPKKLQVRVNGKRAPLPLMHAPICFRELAGVTGVHEANYVCVYAFAVIVAHCSFQCAVDASIRSKLIVIWRAQE